MIPYISFHDMRCPRPRIRDGPREPRSTELVGGDRQENTAVMQEVIANRNTVAGAPPSRTAPPVTGVSLSSNLRGTAASFFTAHLLTTLSGPEPLPVFPPRSSRAGVSFDIAPIDVAMQRYTRYYMHAFDCVRVLPLAQPWSLPPPQGPRAHRLIAHRFAAALVLL